MWGAQYVSNVGGWMQTVAAQWLVLTLTSSATYVALVQTASSLPVVLFALLAGAAGDLVDRWRFQQKEHLRQDERLTIRDKNRLEKVRSFTSTSRDTLVRPADREAGATPSLHSNFPTGELDTTRGFRRHLTCRMAEVRRPGRQRPVRESRAGGPRKGATRLEKKGATRLEKWIRCGSQASAHRLPTATAAMWNMPDSESVVYH
jgi:hypothetical protein